MLDSVMGFVSDNTGLLVGGGTAGIVLWVLQKVPNEEIKNMVHTFFFGLGRTMTLGLSKWKITKGVWNSTIEPWFVDLLENVVGGAVDGFIKGMRVDNEE